MNAKHVGSVVGGVRPLSTYERLFWAFDVVSGFNFSIAVSLRGRKTQAEWVAAFAAVQKRHPFLNVAVNADDEHAPFFTHGEGAPIPIAFEQRNSRTEWQRVMESEMVNLFDQTRAPLMRAVLLEDEEGCDLVLTANHIVIDGIGVVAMVRYLLAALAGERLECLAAPLSAEERIAEVMAKDAVRAAQITRVLEAAKAAAAEAAAAAAEAPAATLDLTRTFALRKGGGKPKIEAIKFCEEETERLLICARREETTLRCWRHWRLRCGGRHRR